MYSNAIYKVAPRGEGKTKWLIHNAYDEIHSLDDDPNSIQTYVYLIVKDANEAQHFSEMYFSLYNEVCKVNFVVGSNLISVPYGSIILIDNLLLHTMNTRDLHLLIARCKKAYITIEGVYGFTNTQVRTVDLQQINMLDELGI